MLQRHQLVWLDDAGWRQVLRTERNVQDSNCLALWAVEHLPLVVTRQRTARLALGVAAPLRFDRRRIAVEIDPDRVLRHGEFAPAASMASQLEDSLRAPWLALCDQLARLGCAARVYGAYGWQTLTGLAYVHASSDIDLLLPVNDLDSADAVCDLLAGAPAALPRLDGELTFADGAGIAWREWVQARSGQVPQVLVKRLHGVAFEPAELPAGGDGMLNFIAPAHRAADLQRVCEGLGRAAIVSLYDELALAPKPGLVTFADSGSHDDMDAGTFWRSLFALRGYFPQIALLGAAHAEFAQLEAAGIQAEANMLAATDGVNTHRGAIFTLGLLCAAGAALHATGERRTPQALRAALLRLWEPALHERAQRRTDSKGARVARSLDLRGVGDEAALGFPVLFEQTLPALRWARAQGLSPRLARLHALFTAMAWLDDTTLAHRGGMRGLRFGQTAACEFLQAGGAARPDAIQHAETLHREFVRRRLSPGGAADTLAAACWLDRVCVA